MTYQPTRLETALHDRLDDGLRSFWTYSPSGEYTLTYTRSDLDNDSVRQRIEGVVELYQDEHQLARGSDDDVLTSLHGAVHMFDEVFAMHLMAPDAPRGIGFSMEPDVGRSLNEFLHECGEILLGD